VPPPVSITPARRLVVAGEDPADAGELAFGLPDREALLIAAAELLLEIVHPGRIEAEAPQAFLAHRHARFEVSRRK
jgi:hypothetical protein